MAAIGRAACTSIGFFHTKSARKVHRLAVPKSKWPLQCAYVYFAIDIILFHSGYVLSCVFLLTWLAGCIELHWLGCVDCRSLVGSWDCIILILTIQVSKAVGLHCAYPSVLTQVIIIIIIIQQSGGIKSIKWTLGRIPIFIYINHGVFRIKTQPLKEEESLLLLGIRYSTTTRRAK